MSAIYDPFMRRSEVACLTAWRRELLADASGDVLEIGAGTGANLPLYPASVRRLVLSEPDPHMRRRLTARAEREASTRASIAAASAETLPFPEASFDFVVSTLVLCSVPDPARTLGEIFRVLRPGGALLYLEHVAADEPSRFAWQRRLEPAWRRVAGDCHLTRRTGETIRGAGLVVEREARESVRKALPVVRPSIRGVARRPG